MVENISSDNVVLEVGGISYRVFTPTSTISQLPQLGNEAKLFTHLHVREDALTLFGFLTRQELEMFVTLIGVSGIGPKAALNILSAVSPEELSISISSGNAESLTRIPGIGKKMAGRLVLELRGKTDFVQLVDGFAPGNGANSDVIAALTSLGYSAVEISAVLKNIGDAGPISVEEQIRLALQHFASSR